MIGVRARLAFQDVCHTRRLLLKKNSHVCPGIVLCAAVQEADTILSRSGGATASGKLRSGRIPDIVLTAAHDLAQCAPLVVPSASGNPRQGVMHQASGELHTVARETHARCSSSMFRAVIIQ